MEIYRRVAVITVKRQDGAAITEKCTVVVHDDGQWMLQWPFAFTPALGDVYSMTLDSK